jgi:catechol 2,3-dioxygenase-like lactoylglutathione lyase family enzyme
MAARFAFLGQDGGVRITAVEVLTAAPEAQRAFYGEALGLPIEDGSDGRFTAVAGGTRITFAPVADRAPIAHLAFNVPENRIEAGRDWVAERTPVLPLPGDLGEIMDFSFWNAHALYFDDAEGNVLELIARHNLPNASDDAFGPGSLLEVSEVGCQSPDVGVVASWLEEELGLPFFSGDRENFAAVGDERGVFILVPEGRPWLPTDNPASRHPHTVTIEGGPAGEHHPPGPPFTIVGGG